MEITSAYFDSITAKQLFNAGRAQDDSKFYENVTGFLLKSSFCSQN